MMEVKIKKMHHDAIIPKYAKHGDAGLDLTCVTKEIDEFGNIVYGTGLAFEIPDGFVGLLFPRSSNSKKYLRLTNSVGVLDSGYRGEVLFKFKHDSFSNLELQYKVDYLNVVIGLNNDYEIGDRIGQILILPYPKIEFVEVEMLSNSERGYGGYGSTGK